MLFHIDTNHTDQLKASVEDMREMFKRSGEIQGDEFYLTDDNLLFIDAKVSNEVVGQLDKMVCSLEAHASTELDPHRVLIEWSKQNANRG